MNTSVSPLPADWSAVLDHIQESVARTLEEVEQREQAMASGDRPELPPGAGDQALRETLAQVAERMFLFQSSLGQAEASAAEAESALADGERAIQTWLAAAESARQRLARAGPAKI